jgi:hypothetical protein
VLPPLQCYQSRIRIVVYDCALEMTCELDASLRHQLCRQSGLCVELVQQWPQQGQLCLAALVCTCTASRATLSEGSHSAGHPPLGAVGVLLAKKVPCGSHGACSEWGMGWQQGWVVVDSGLL